jgi:phosphate uptake regulator
MERKLIKQGGGGYTIYLPKPWVEKKGLKQGDIISVEEKDASLVIGGSCKKKEEFLIKLDEENKFNIKVFITHIYREGFNKIRITGIDAGILKQVKKVVKDLLLGFELTKITSDEVVIENISEPTETKYQVILDKVFLIIKETNAVLKKDFHEKSFHNLEEIEELRNSGDKFVLFCKRVLTMEKYSENLSLEWELLTFLMHIEHAYYYLYRFVADKKIKDSDKFVKFLIGLESNFDLFCDAYKNKSIESINKINQPKRKLHFGKLIDLLEKSSSRDAVIYSYLREIFRLIQIGASPIFGQILHKELN